jgi:hypothetical protein
MNVKKRCFFPLLESKLNDFIINARANGKFNFFNTLSLKLENYTHNNKFL